MFLRTIRQLRRDERGHIVIYFTIMLPVLLGMIGLSLDGARLFALHDELQDLADAAALAGARELLGDANAITRADGVARNLLNNDPRWANAAASGAIILAGTAGVQFYSQIPPDVLADEVTA